MKKLPCCPANLIKIKSCALNNININIYLRDPAIKMHTIVFLIIWEIKCVLKMKSTELSYQLWVGKKGAERLGCKLRTYYVLGYCEILNGKFLKQVTTKGKLNSHDGWILWIFLWNLNSKFSFYLFFKIFKILLTYI